jgi:hypothetical protein
MVHEKRNGSTPFLNLFTNLANVCGPVAISLHLLVTYENGSYDSTTNTIEWMVTGMDTDFTHDTPADPSQSTCLPLALLVPWQ